MARRGDFGNMTQRRYFIAYAFVKDDARCEGNTIVAANNLWNIEQVRALEKQIGVMLGVKEPLIITNVECLDHPMIKAQKEKSLIVTPRTG